MKLFDFSDINFVIFFFVTCGLIVIGAFVLATFLIFNRKDNIGNRQIKSQSYGTKIYLIDVKKNVVTYFSKSNLRIRNEVDMNGFYSKFAASDVDKVKSWIFNICLDFKNADPYLEVDMISEKGRGSHFSLLKLLKYNAVEGIIHAESCTLKYISPSLSQKKTKGLPIGLVKRSTMEEIITKEKSTKGYTFAIRFFYRKQLVLANEKIERYMMMTLKNAIYPFATNSRYPRQIVDDGDNEVLLFDLKIDACEEGLRLASSISKALKKCIGVNGFANSVNFCIGVLENSFFYHDFNSMVDKAQEASMSGQRNNQEIVLYQKQAKSNSDLVKYRYEIDKLLKPFGMRYLFRPILDSEKHRVIGYFSYVKTYDSPFTNYSEIAKYAALVDKTYDLFATIAKYIIPKFASECDSATAKLFLKASILDIENIIPILAQIPESKKVKLVIAFDEQEINENSRDLELINNLLDSLKKEGLKICMLMKDKNLLLDSSIYENFDYFVAGSSMIGEIKVNNRSRLSIHSLIEQLLKYKKPIIATDLESWQSIELIIKSGISILSTEVISPSNDMLLPIEKKKMEKLKEIYEKYN